MLGLITALALCLIAIQLVVFHAAAKASASAYMDAASAKSLMQLEAQISELDTVIRILATSPFLADNDERSEVGGAIGLFKTALRRLPQADSIYVGYDNGCWLQLRSAADLDESERQRLGAPPGTASIINLVHPEGVDGLPLRRVFLDVDNNKIGQIDLWDYGYDVRKRPWYQETLRVDRPVVSAPYLAFSTGAPVITLSAPLRGAARGVIAADLKLSAFSDFVYAQRPGEHGTAIVFDESGTLLAHPDYKKLIDDAQTQSGNSQLPNIRDLRDPLIAEILDRWHHADHAEGSVRDWAGDEFFRLQKFSLGDLHTAYMLVIAQKDDFVGDVRRLQIRGLVLAILAGGCFVPVVWFFGNGISRSLRRVAAQAGRLHTLADPEPIEVRSRITEIRDLADTMNAAERAVWSFSRFVPKDIVRGIIDDSISTDLGGVRQEVSILFTDVYNFTGIAEAAAPDALMRQTSRHFTALTEAFLAEGGTVDKFIGDAVMVFWNAPRPQPDHVDRACRAALAAKAASDALNVKFAAEGLASFEIRIGVHVGDVVVGNIGSAERMEYTALGTTVNLAARLEGLNKDYGTSILVSKAVRDRANDRFGFKSVASVIAKGMSSPTQVYELLASANQNEPLPGRHAHF
ncbi:MAG TPA: adenylate/guanylate cyclase domain-containing protein [Stellaceae bacterium]|nr:adenylate/guanylate cyclase domain-containing protein [Stellaceae bacterium]